MTEEGTAEDSSVVQIEGQRKIQRPIRFYNLDVIISVGYRVKSQQGTRFRQWATRTLRDHIVKGYTVSGFGEFTCEGDTLTGRIYIHDGDDSSFVAKKTFGNGLLP